MPKLEVVTHADALIQEHPTGLWWQRMAAAMLGGIGQNLWATPFHTPSQKSAAKHILVAILTENSHLQPQRS